MKGANPCKLTIQAWIESIPIATLAVMSEGAVLAVNEPAAIMGFREESHISDFLPFNHPSLIEASMTQAFDSNERVVIQVFHALDHQEYDIAFSPFKSADLEVCIVVITRSHKSGETMERLEAGHKFITMGRLSAGVLHDIRSPVQYISDNIRFVRESVSDIVRFIQAVRDFVSQDEESLLAQRFAKILSEGDIDYLLSEIPPALGESQEGIRQVRNILDAMKKFSHPGLDKKEMVNLNDTIESALTITHSEWKSVAEMKTNLDPALPKIPIYSDEMNQVLLNLIVNATHAVQEKKDVTGENGIITITTKHRDREVVLWVSDTGAGMPRSILAKIFQPFFTTKKPGDGTGQGLALVHSIIVEKHGGTISVLSEPGSGAVFEIHLPTTDLDKLQDGKGV